MALATKKSESKCEVQMTAMIDVVFQLLIFFMLSFKIVVHEGDFNVKMPARGSRNSIDDSGIPPIKVRLTKHADGGLGAITMNDKPIDGFPSLREKIIQAFGTQGGPGSNLAAAEVEFDCDYDLKYEHVMNAITAVSGFSKNGHIIKLVEKIKFSTPHMTGG